MAIVGGFALHRAQMTYDWVDADTGETARGRIEPAVRPVLAEWLAELPADDGAFAVEATTGWRFVVEELVTAGFQAHVAEPADTSAMRGPKRRAKTDKYDARHIRELLQIGRLPTSHAPPSHLLDLRRTVRLRKTLADQRGEWQQRIHATVTVSPAGQFQRAQRCLRARSARTPNTHPTMRHAGGSNTATRSAQFTLPPLSGTKTQRS